MIWTTLMIIHIIIIKSSELVKSVLHKASEKGNICAKALVVSL